MWDCLLYGSGSHNGQLWTGMRHVESRRAGFCNVEWYISFRRGSLLRDGDTHQKSRGKVPLKEQHLPNSKRIHRPPARERHLKEANG